MAESSARRQEVTREGIPGIEFLDDVPDGKEGISRHPSYAVVINREIFRQVDHGQMTPEDAERVWQRSVADWDLLNIDQHFLKTAVAASMIQASSQARDYSQVLFSVGEDYYALNVIASHAALHTDGDAAIRVWARSYNHADIPCRMSDILNTPQNVEYRNAAAFRYQCNFKKVKFAFDLAKDMLESGRRFTDLDRRTIRTMRAVKTTEAQLSANQKGLALALPDSDARRDLEEEHVLAAPSESRTKFASMK